MIKKLLVCTFLGFFLWFQSNSQIAAWDFTGIGSTTIASTPATTFNSNLVSSSGANNITRGSSAGWSTGSNSWRTTGFQNNGIATSNTDYFQITLTASTGYKLSLSTIDAKFAGTSSFAASPGVSNQFAYSLDGTSFTLIGSAQTLIGTPATLTQIDLTGISALQNIAAGTTVTLRYYASGQTTTGGWGFNSPSSGQNGLAIGGSVVSTTSTATDYFRSKQTGNWSSTSTWESSSDNSSWISATLTPTSSANTISILAGHTVTLDANTSVSNTSIAGTGVLNVAPGIVITVPSSKTVTNAGTLALKSDATGTASIGNSTGNITGNLTVEKYIAGGGLSTDVPSQRAYRFLSHPFNAAIPLSQLQTAIDITGSGAGFDASGSNNPSAFSWNGANATSATGTSNNGGWTAFTSTASSSWAQYQGIRLFYRGAKGTGLSGAAYTVGSATLSMTGSITTGSKTINLNYPNTGTFTNLNLVGNPYPSNVQMSGITNTNTTSSYYVWNLGLGNRGGYTTVSFGSSYVLPAYAAFFVESSTASASLTFNESNKTTSAPTNSLLRTNVPANQLVLQLKSDNILWDEWVLNNDAKAVAASEYADGKKLMNPDASLYSITTDGTELAIDNRSLNAGTTTALGIATGVARNFTIEVKEIGTNLRQLYLVDKYLNTTQAIEAGMVYSFSTNADAASQGNARFEIVSKGITPLPTLATNFSVKLSPNPATDVVKLAFTNTEALPTSIQVKDLVGKTVKTLQLGSVQAGNITLLVSELPKGIYFVTLTNGVNTQTEKLIVQ